MYLVTIYNVTTEKAIITVRCNNIDDACDTRDLLIDDKMFNQSVGGMVQRIN